MRYRVDPPLDGGFVWLPQMSKEPIIALEWEGKNDANGRRGGLIRRVVRVGRWRHFLFLIPYSRWEVRG